MATLPENITVEQFVGLLKTHFNIVAIGLSVSNPQIPAHILMMTMAAAFGRVISDASASPDIATTLSLRSQCMEAFSSEVKKHMPALRAANTIPANGSH